MFNNFYITCLLLTKMPIITLPEQEFVFSYMNNLNYDNFINEFKIDLKYKSYSFDKCPNFYSIGTTKGTLYLEDRSMIYLINYKLKIIDDVPPLLFGPSKLILNKSNLSIDNLIQNYIAYDEIDHDLKISIQEHNYDKNVNEGNYFFILFTQDKSKNSTSKKVNVTIKKNTIYENNLDFKLTLEKKSFYYESEIIEILKNKHLLNNQNVQYHYLNLTEKNIFSSTGIKNISLASDDLKTKINIQLNVIDKIETKQSIFYSFFKNLFEKLIQFLRNIFNTNI